MINLLAQLVHNFICWVETAVIFVVNLILIALGAIVQAVVLILPPMPDLPGMPGPVQSVIAFASYIFPLSFIFSLLALCGEIWLAWLMLAIPLRWAKAIGGNA
jgi:hypothetical protein